MDFCKTSVGNFLRIPFIDGLILGMTLFLCVVIFSELGIPPELFLVEGSNEKTFLGQIYYVINYFLLTFFVIEIALKLFSDTYSFISEFINVFDSIVVLVSFGFQIADVDVSFVGLLRILRLIKVITEMKKQADKKREEKELIKQQKSQSN
jgi:hypothetical protein